MARHRRQTKPESPVRQLRHKARTIGQAGSSCRGERKRRAKRLKHCRLTGFVGFDDDIETVGQPSIAIGSRNLRKPSTAIRRRYRLMPCPPGYIRRRGAPGHASRSKRRHRPFRSRRTASPPRRRAYPLPKGLRGRLRSGGRQGRQTERRDNGPGARHHFPACPASRPDP